MPYVASRIIESKLLYGFNGPYRSQTRIQFSAYGVGHDATAALGDAFAAAFDAAVLALSAGTHASTTRLNDPTPKLHHHDADGNDVWEWQVSYEFDVLL